MLLQNRRKFISNSIQASASIALSSKLPLFSKAAKPLNILLLGGTGFLGPHQIAAALRRGHSITTFTRGKTPPEIYKDLFDKVEKLIGDRENDLEALKNRKWDAVIDNSGRQVAWTDATANLLKDNVEQYMYISSVSVFYPYLKQHPSEADKLVLEMPADMDESEKGLYDYGTMKANSELAAEKHFGKKRTISVRPTFMVGPGDRVDRFMYWPVRLAEGGEIILPGKADDPVQFIDVRDIADWMIGLLEQKAHGTFNGVGPESRMSVTEFVNNGASAFDVESTFVQIDDHAFLKDNQLRFQTPWVLPEGKFLGMMQATNQKALDTGLKCRPVAETIFDSNAWWYSEAVSQERRDDHRSNSLIAREKDIIAAWRAHKK